MPHLVVGGAVTRCTMGTATGRLNVPPTTGVLSDAKPVATVADFLPFSNVAPFSMCRSPQHPAVAAAGAAALGVPTPMPCTPVIVAPWQPGSATVHVRGRFALSDDSTCRCAYGGVISVVAPGQNTASAP